MSSPRWGRPFLLAASGFSGSASGAPLAPVPTGKDITGGAVTTGVYLPPGVTALLTATLVPTAAAGTVVTGTLNVDSNTSASNQFPDGSPDPGALETIAALPYTYTVG
jgi:hypothetical protein